MITLQNNRITIGCLKQLLCLILTHKKPKIRAWRFDFLWDLQAQNVVLASVPNVFIQTRMKQCIDEFVVAMDHEEIEENNISRT